MGHERRIGEVPELSAEELASLIGTDREPFMLDVRTPHEVAEWSIPGVVNVPLADLPARLPEVPTSGDVVVICASGGRSAAASAFLDQEGYAARNLTGGMSAWGRVYDTASVGTATGELVQVRRRGKGCLSYLLGSGGEAFVVDPSLEIDVYLDLASAQGRRITRVFDTHLHADHLSGARALASRVGAHLHLNALDGFAFDFEPVQDHQRFLLDGGLDVSVSAVHTPGHTEGSTIFAVGGTAVLSGDTLFVDGVGRPDLADRAEQFARNLYRSLHERVLVLGDAVSVLPAHYSTAARVVPGEPVTASIGTLRASLPALSMSEEDFVTWSVGRATERPPNYLEILKANRGASSLTAIALARLEVGPNRCSV